MDFELQNQCDVVFFLKVKQLQSKILYLKFDCMFQITQLTLHYSRVLKTEILYSELIGLLNRLMRCQQT